MKYYRVKAEYDNLQQYNGKKVLFEGIWIGKELYTKTELNRLVQRGVFVHPKYFDEINISKSKIYWLFGARFAMEE